jgi:hypothetical protein
MKSNGFGSFEQIIVFSVDTSWGDKVAHLPGMKPIEIDDDPGRSFFEWRNWSTKQGDDEGAVWYLTLAFKEAQDCNWKIDWDKSIY